LIWIIDGWLCGNRQMRITRTETQTRLL
jgi:hypothetical protein